MTHKGQSFSEKLRGEMDARNMGARTLARLIEPENIEQARKTVRRWLGGMTPTQANRDKVTDALGLERGALDPDPDDEDLNVPLMRAIKAALADDEVKAGLRRWLDRDETRSAAA